MPRFNVVPVLLTLALAAPAAASEIGDSFARNFEAGTLAEGRDEAVRLCTEGDTEACFVAGMTELVGGIEHLSEAFYRHGAVAPDNTPAAMVFGLSYAEAPTPANPEPEPLSYDQLRDYLNNFVARMDLAQNYFEQAGGEGDYVLRVDPLAARIDFNGNGKVDDGETLAALIDNSNPTNFYGYDYEIPSEKKRQSKAAGQDTTVGFDRADAFWFAGYSQIAATPVDLILAHDFSGFFDAYMHRFFPAAGLPLQGYSTGGDSLFGGGPETDRSIADLVAGIHLTKFPVAQPERLAGVLDRLKAITALSRRNWEAILLETDDDRELVPSPSQTSIIPGMKVTETTVDAWTSTLDTLDRILAGELLVPHWRFEDKGVDLAAYFNGATETDLVLIVTGHGVLPFLAEGEIASAADFAEGNAVFGDAWPQYLFWFN